MRKGDHLALLLLSAYLWYLFAVNSQPECPVQAISTEPTGLVWAGGPIICTTIYISRLDRNHIMVKFVHNISLCSKIFTVGTVLYYMIANILQQWYRKNMGQTWNSLLTPHSSPSRVSYEVSFVSPNYALCSALRLLYGQHYMDGLMQERRNSIANALELPLSCTKPSISLPLSVL